MAFFQVAVFGGACRPFTHPAPLRRYEFPSGEVDVGKGEEREHLCTVLLDAPVANLPIAELAFQNAEHVSDLGANRAVLLVERTLGPRE